MWGADTLLFLEKEAGSIQLLSETKSFPANHCEMVVWGRKTAKIF